MNREIIDTESGEKNENRKRRLPLFAVIFLALGGVAAILYLSFILFEGFADIFNRYISSAVRAVFAYATGWLPFSLAESTMALPFARNCSMSMA